MHEVYSIEAIWYLCNTLLMLLSLRYLHSPSKTVGLLLISVSLRKQAAGDIFINPEVGCHYFVSCPQLPSQRDHPWPVPNYTVMLCEHRRMSVNDLPGVAG